jgi:hypothetical protein
LQARGWHPHGHTTLLTLCLYRHEPSADFSPKIRKRIAQPNEKRRKKTYEAVPVSRCFKSMPAENNGNMKFKARTHENA